jgi:hypothetical protein
MKKKNNSTNLLNKLSLTIEEKTLALKKMSQTKQEIARVKETLEEPARKTIALNSDAQIASAVVLQIVEKVENQETILKSLQSTANDPITLAKSRALLLNKAPPPPPPPRP